MSAEVAKPRHPLPAPELLEAARAGDRKAIDAVIAATMWIVNAQIKGMRLNGQFREDYVQVALAGGEGRDQFGGLLRAIQTFDPSKGANFWTHATAWIRGAIARERSTRSDASLLNYRSQRRYKKKAARRLERKLGRPPTREELAEALPYTLDCTTAAKLSISTFECTRNSHSKHWRAYLTATSDGGGEAVMTRKLLAQHAADLIDDVLRPIEACAFRLHVFEHRKFAEIGEELGISREWARQHYIMACQRLKAALTEAA